MPKVTSLIIYPVKGLGALAVQRSLAEERGFCFDRRFMLVDEHGEFLSQRNCPKMSQIWFEPTTHRAWTVHASGFPTFDLPRVPDSGSKFPARIWLDHVTVHHVSEEADHWFSTALSRRVRLVHMSEQDNRLIESRPGVPEGARVSFADGYPILLTSEESLVDLNARMLDSIPMNRFRPNIVVSGLNPFEEDEWDEIAIGDTHLKIVKPCKRCEVTTIDQVTAEKHKDQEPLRTLSTFRKSGGGVFFGQNLIVLRPGFVEVGQEVHVLKRNPQARLIKNS